MRDGADHPMTVEYDTKCMNTSPIRAVCAKLGRDESVLFLEDLPTAELGNVHRGKTLIPAPDIPKALHTDSAGKRTAFTTHFFRWEGALTRALAGEDLLTIMRGLAII